MPVIVDSWVQAAKDGVQNAAASLNSVAPQASDVTMPSLRTLGKIAFTGAQVLLGGQGVVGDFTQSCPAPQLSCHNTTVVENLCCFNAPGGQILQTQFWDTSPPTGPDDSWTLHGLWYVSFGQLIIGCSINLSQARPLRRHIRRKLRSVSRIHEHLCHPDLVRRQ